MSGSQLDIDSIEATVAALTEEAGEGGTLIERDVPALCQRVRQLEQALAAVEKVCDQAEYGATRWEHPLPIPEWVPRVRAALGGAVTPTPQEPKCICDGGAYIDKMKPDWRPFVVNPQCVLHGIGPSTPKAATERLLVPIEAIWACIDAGHDVGQRHRGGHLDTATCHDCRTPYDRYWSPGAPSGLQRGHPTLMRCPLCPSYLNHDGAGGVYCPEAAEHLRAAMRHCCFAGCTNVVCGRCGKTYCANVPMHDCRPTPEAATEPEGHETVMKPRDDDELDAHFLHGCATKLRKDGFHGVAERLDAIAARLAGQSASGLQRATEQQ